MIPNVVMTKTYGKGDYYVWEWSMMIGIVHYHAWEWRFPEE
jgi:hypothetical protein